jgi:hypothetical protein
MTTQSASRGGETYVVVGDKIGCSQPSIYSSTFTELADALGPLTLRHVNLVTESTIKLD